MSQKRPSSRVVSEEEEKQRKTPRKGSPVAVSQNINAAYSLEDGEVSEDGSLEEGEVREDGSLEDGEVREDGSLEEGEVPEDEASLSTISSDRAGVIGPFDRPVRLWVNRRRSNSEGGVFPSRDALVGFVKFTVESTECAMSKVESQQDKNDVLEQSLSERLDRLNLELNDAEDELEYYLEESKEMDPTKLVVGQYALEVREALCDDLKGCVCQTKYYDVEDMTPARLFQWLSKNPEYVDLPIVEYESLEPLYIRIQEILCPRDRVAHPVVVLKDRDVLRKCQSEFLRGLDPTCQRMVARASRRMERSIDDKSNDLAGKHPEQISFSGHGGRVGLFVKR